MKFTMKAVLCVLALTLGTAAYGEDDRKWGDEAELSLVDTSGNTEVTTLAVKNTLKYFFNGQTFGSWKLELLYGKSEGVTNAERYSTEFRLDHSYTEALYSYANTGWLKDRFAGIDSSYYLGAGAGYRFMRGPKHHLSGEAGLTYNVEDYTDGSDKNYLGGRLFGLYEYAFNEKNRFSQSLELLLDFDDFEGWSLNSETALTSALNSFLSLKASYVVNYDNDPIPGVERTDTTLGVTVVASF